MRRNLGTFTLIPALTMLAAGLLFPVGVFAQFETATLLRTVRDPNGSVIEGASVTLKNVATGISSSVTDVCKRRLSIR